MEKSVIILLATLCAFAAAKAETKISENRVAELARILCKEPSKHMKDLNSISSMLQLIDYFENMSFADKLYQCRQRYLGSLRYLEIALNLDNDNVCSDEKISLLEEFNLRYISTSFRDAFNQKEDDMHAPEALKVFFVHYAYQISSVCKRSLLAVLEKSPVLFVDQNGQPANLEKLDKMIQGFYFSFALNPRENGYKDLILPWKMVDSLHIPNFAKDYMRELQLDDGVSHVRLPVRISVRMNGGDSIRKLQKICRESLKPDYSKLVLPIMRLLHIGLYRNNEPLARSLNRDENLQRLFAITQICQTLIPIEIFQDDLLASGKIVLMSPEVAAEIRATQVDQAGCDLDLIGHLNEQDDGESPTLGDLDEIPTLTNADEADFLTEAIRYNRVEHERVIRKMLHIGSTQILSAIKTSAGRSVELSSPSDNGRSLTTNVEVEESAALGPVKRNRRALAASISAMVILILLVPQVFCYLTRLLVEGALFVSWPIFKLFGKDVYDYAPALRNSFDDNEIDKDKME